MTTLQVLRAAGRAPLASHPVVRDLQVKASFPHGLSIRVIEQPPAAALTVGGVRTAVAADGVVLGPAQLSGSLPALTGSGTLAPGAHVRDAALLGALSVLGAVPAPLARQVTRAFNGPKGLTVVMRSGLLAYFGDGSRPHAKWLSLARVLADSSSAGASYVDLRLPERPAAGFPAGVAPPSSSGSEAGASSPGASGGESSEALAEGLSVAVGGGSSVARQTGSSGSSSGEEESSSGAEAPATTSGEAAGSAGAESSESTPAPGG
jgi:cell division protein FtsQ